MAIARQVVNGIVHRNPKSNAEYQGSTGLERNTKIAHNTCRNKHRDQVGDDGYDNHTAGAEEYRNQDTDNQNGQQDGFFQVVNQIIISFDKDRYSSRDAHLEGIGLRGKVAFYFGLNDLLNQRIHPYRANISYLERNTHLLACTVNKRPAQRRVVLLAF